MSRSQANRNESTNKQQFHKIKKTLEKKLDELKTLCGVEGFMIIYGGPKKNNDCSVQSEIWPANSSEIKCCISFYNNQPNDEGKKRTIDLSDLLESRKKWAENELKKLHKKKEKEPTKYLTWDAQYDEFSMPQLKEMDDRLTNKLERVKQILDNKKGENTMVAPTMMNNLSTQNHVDSYNR